MTRQQAIEVASRQATELPMANPALIAGIIDILASLDVVRFTPDLPHTDELFAHKVA